MSEAETALSQGALDKARGLLLHCIDLPLNFLQLTKVNNLRKRLAGSLKNSTKLRFAILAGSTSVHLRVALESNLWLRGVEAEVYESPFGGVEQEILSPQSGLYRFSPSHVLLWPSSQDLLSRFEARELSNFDRELRDLWAVLRKNLPTCEILQTTLVTPPERPHGVIESCVEESITTILRQLNSRIFAHASSVRIVDLDWLSAIFGRQRWHDPRLWFGSKHAFHLDATSLVSNEIARLVGATLGLSRKCLILDLDNTLWGGTIGDDGLDGILVGEGAVGEAYIAFQRYVKRLRERGVILAICSKNNEQVAKEPFEKHPRMILKESDIAHFRASWGNKVDAIREIAEALNIGLDSLVFCDDNPAERKLVRDYVPEVYTVEMPEDPSLYVEALDRLGLFSSLQVSGEDLNRTEQYRANKSREELKGRLSSLEDFLKDLRMEGTVLKIDQKNWERPLQLINKSNQFNLMTNRYTPAEFQALVGQPDWLGCAFRLLDRFGDNGIVAVVTGRVLGTRFWIEDWVMSCRVLSRGMESFTYNALAQLALAKGCQSIVARYRPTNKNGLVAGLLPELGFTPIDQTQENLSYSQQLETHRPRPHYIQEKEHYGN